MNNFCGADCSKCDFNQNCKGCCETCGKPFGGSCVAAEYIKTGGKDAYIQFKQSLLNELNNLLTFNELPLADNLYELAGSFVNLAYRLPSGETVKMLDDSKIYLGCQIECAELGVCYGVVADMDFILVCSYTADGSNPELLIYKKR